MVKRAGVYDAQFVRDVLTNEDVFKWLRFDGFNPENINPIGWLLHPNVYVLMIGPDCDAGVMVFLPVNGMIGAYEVHIAVLKKFRGKAVLQYVNEGIEWMAKNANMKRVVSYAPEFNYPAIILAKRMGAVEIGRLKEMWKRDGKLYDCIYFRKEVR